MAHRQSNFQAIGTEWELRISEHIATDAWVQLLQRIYAHIETFDLAYSRFRTDSLVTRMSREGGAYRLPADAWPMLDFYHKLYTATNGKVTPLIGRTMEDAGYDAAYSLTSKPLRPTDEWDDSIAYGKHELTLTKPALLDFGAAGKGYLVDIIAGMLEDAGIQTYSVNAGGDIRQRTVADEPLVVGLENPLDTTEAIGTAQLTNKSLCASAGSKRTWGDYHHIIDPVSLQSPTRILATWVLANDTMTADGLATALFFTDAATLKQHFTFSHALLRDDMSLEHDRDFPINLFKAD